MIDFIPARDGGLGILIGGEPGIFIERLRHQGRGLRACGKRGGARGNT
jgi:hypothetical protein